MANIHASSESGKNIENNPDDFRQPRLRKKTENKNGPVVVKNFIPIRRDGFTKDYTVSKYLAEQARFWKGKAGEGNVRSPKAGDSE